MYKETSGISSTLTNVIPVISAVFATSAAMNGDTKQALICGGVSALMTIFNIVNTRNAQEAHRSARLEHHRPVHEYMGAHSMSVAVQQNDSNA